VAQAVVTRPDNAERMDQLQDAGVNAASASFDKIWREPTKARIRTMVRE